MKNLTDNESVKSNKICAISDKKEKGPEWKFSPVFKIQYPMKNRDKNTTICHISYE